MGDPLAAAGRVIPPGAGGAPEFATPWRFELICSEALDPATITTETIQMHEIRSGAFTEAPATADPGHMGDVVIIKTAQDIGHRVYLANVGEKLIAQPFTF